MGFFSDTVITVHATNVPLFSGEFPNTIKDAVLRAISLDEDITSHILTSLFTGFNRSLKQYFSYGENHYWRGLPDGKNLAGTADPVPIKAAIEHYFTKEPITLISYSVGYPDVTHYVYQTLVYYYGYNYVTGILTGLSSDQIYATYNGWGYTDANITIHYTLSDIGGDYTETKTIVLDHLPDKFSYYKAIYTIDSGNPNEFFYFIYDGDTNIEPSLPPISPESIDFSYYPIASIMVDKKKVGGNEDDEGNKENPEQYNQTSTLLGKIDLNIEEIWDAINESPDIEDIDDAYFLFGANIHSESEPTIEYLTRYFYYLFNSNPNSKEAFEALLTVQLYQPFITEIEEDQYKFVFGYNYIDLEVKTGVVSELNKYTKELVYRDDLLVKSGDFEEGISSIYAANSSLYLRLQFSETQYYELEVRGLISRHKIKIGDSKIRVDDEWQYFPVYKEVDKPIWEGDFIIPVSNTILDEMNIRDKEVVCLDSMHLSISAIHEEELSWYESSFFGTLIEVVVTFVSFYIGVMELNALIQNIAKVGITQVLKQLAKAIIINLIFDWLGKAIGGAFGALISAIGKAALSAYTTGNFVIDGLPLADTVLKLVIDTAKTYEKIIAEDFQELKEEYNEFLEDVANDANDLEELNELIGLSTNVYDLSYIDKSYDALMENGETPSQFINRKVHLQNPGLLSIEAVHSYVENALTLPKSPEDLL